MAQRILRPPTAFSVDLSSSRKKRPRVNNESHLKFIRELPCLVTGMRPVDPAHIRYSDPRFGKRKPGIGEKPDDKWCVPLHRSIHTEQHENNEREWWIKQGIDPVVVASALWGVTGDTEAAELIISQAKKLVHPRREG